MIRIDDGVDTGPILLQKSFAREGTETFAEIERRIHGLEHQWFPYVVLSTLDQIDGMASGDAGSPGADRASPSAAEESAS